MKKFILFLITFYALSFSAFGQEIKITGSVYDKDSETWVESNLVASIETEFIIFEVTWLKIEVETKKEPLSTAFLKGSTFSNDNYYGYPELYYHNSACDRKITFDENKGLIIHTFESDPLNDDPYGLYNESRYETFAFNSGEDRLRLISFIIENKDKVGIDSNIDISGIR